MKTQIRVKFNQDGIVLIEDACTDGYASVTNNAEAIVKYAVAISSPSARIFYIDSDGRIDELLHENKVFVGFGKNGFQSIESFMRAFGISPFESMDDSIKTVSSLLPISEFQPENLFGPYNSLSETTKDLLLELSMVVPKFAVIMLNMMWYPETKIIITPAEGVGMIVPEDFTIPKACDPEVVDPVRYYTLKRSIAVAAILKGVEK